MANSILEEQLQLINQQITLIEALGVQLLEAKALIAVAEGTDFSEHVQSISRAYFWVLDEIIDEASTLNERCLDTFSRNSLVMGSNNISDTHSSTQE